MALRRMGRWAVPLGALLVAAACGMTGQAAAVDVDARCWSEPAMVAIDNADTLALRDVEFFVRYNVRCAEDTLSLRVVSFTPDSLRCEERVQLCFSRGRAASAVRSEACVRYRLQARLGRSGRYLWSVAPTRPTEGIEAVGVRIEPSR